MDQEDTYRPLPVFHDWPEGSVDWRTEGCEPPTGERWTRLYIQTAINRGYVACPVCIAHRVDMIAYDVRVQGASK
jgi:hypothetical protein